MFGGSVNNDNDIQIGGGGLALLALAILSGASLSKNTVANGSAVGVSPSLPKYDDIQIGGGGLALLALAILFGDSLFVQFL